MFNITDFVPALGILGIAFILAVISKVLQRKLVNKEQMNHQKKLLKEKQKKWKELLKEGDAKKKEAAEIQREILEINSKMLQSTMKFTWVSLPVFLVSFAIMGFIYGGTLFESLIPLPQFTGFFLLNPLSWIPTGITMTTGFYKAYFFYYLIFTIILGIIQKIFERVTLGVEKEVIKIEQKFEHKPEAKEEVKVEGNAEEKVEVK